MICTPPPRLLLIIIGGLLLFFFFFFFFSWFPSVHTESVSFVDDDSRIIPVREIQ